MNLYPLMLNLESRLAVVIGGGSVGMRKATGLVEAGARVRIVSLEKSLACAAGSEIHWLIEPYRPEHLDGAALVFAAATPEVNARVVADAKARGIWVSSANNPEAGDFLVPASLRSGELLITVSTGGAAPAVAKRVRDLLSKQFDDAWAGWLEILKEFRVLIRETIADEERRRALFERFADLSWLDRIRLEGREAVRTEMRRVVDEARLR